MHEDRVRHGTFQEQLTQLNQLLRKAISDGADARFFASTLTHLLKTVETMRVKQESEVARLQAQVAEHVAKARACSTLGSLIVSLLYSKCEEIERQRAEQPKMARDEIRDNIIERAEIDALQLSDEELDKLVESEAQCLLDRDPATLDVDDKELVGMLRKERPVTLTEKTETAVTVDAIRKTLLKG